MTYCADIIDAGNVFDSKYGDHSRLLKRCAGVDAEDASMGMRAYDRPALQHGAAMCGIIYILGTTGYV